MITLREDLLRCLRREGSGKMHVDYVFCESQIRAFNKRFGNNDYESYLGLVVLPGIAAFVLKADIAKADEAYPWLLNHFVPSGIKGFVFAALIAAIISSLAAIINSAATIFSIDIFKVHFAKQAEDEVIVKAGKISGVIMVAIASFIASMLSGLEQVFQFIQEYTGLVSPGITAMFVLGIFW
jgi:SSS family solute:Na+ symporter